MKFKVFKNLENQSNDGRNVNVFFILLVLYGGFYRFTRPISGDGGANQLRGVPVIGRLPTDETRDPEWRESGRK